MNLKKADPNSGREKVDISEREAMTAGSNFKPARHTELCDVCYKEYQKHPLINNVRDRMGKPYLTKLCSGRFVRLGNE